MRTWHRSTACILLLFALLGLTLAACSGAAPARSTTEATAAAALAPKPTEPASSGQAGSATADAGASSGTATPPPETADPPATAAGAGTVSPTGSKTLRMVYRNEPDNADPQKASALDEIDIIAKNFTPLMRFDPKTLRPVPGAAQSVDISADGRTFTFKLRPNQTYSDGKPLTARNFEYAWKRLCDPQTASGYQFIATAIAGCDDYFNAFSAGVSPADKAKLQELRDKVGVTSLDDNTLQITLHEPAPYFLNVTALWVGDPSREDLVQKGGADWWRSPETFVGNGPFKLASWEPNSRIKWVRNDRWVLAKEQPVKLEAIEEMMISDPHTGFEAYRVGELDIDYVQPENYQAVQNDPQLKTQLKDQGGVCTLYLEYNLARKPFDKKEVRQAFAQALDRDGWVRDVLKGLGTPAYSFIRPGIPGHDAGSTKWKYDPRAAKKKLQDASFDFSQELKLTYGQNPIAQERMEYLASRLQKDLGVNITLDPVEPTELTDRLKDPKTTPQWFLAGWCLDYPDPQDWLTAVWKSPGGSAASKIGYANKQFDALVTRADTLKIDDPARAKLYQQAQEILIDDAPAAMFWYDTQPFLQKPWVTGVNSTVMDLMTPGLLDISSIDVKAE